MRGLFVALCLMPLWANASYELVMGIDSSNNRIDRFDGNTGAFLGSFAVGMVGAGGTIAVRPNTPLVYNTTFTTASVQVWNYSTGEFVLQRLTNGFGTLRGMAFNNAGKLMLGTGNGIRIFNPDTFALEQSMGLGSSFTGIGQAPDGSYFGVDTTNGRLVKFNSSGTQLGFVAFPSGDGVSLPWQIAFSGSTGYVSNNTTIFSFTGGTTAPVLGFGYNPGDQDLSFGVAVGHDTRRYAGGKNASGLPTIHSYVDLGSGIFQSHQTMSRAGASLGTYLSLTSVVAPEPATMAALAFGTLMMLKRRRKG